MDINLDLMVEQLHTSYYHLDLNNYKNIDLVGYMDSVEKLAYAAFVGIVAFAAFVASVVVVHMNLELFAEAEADMVVYIELLLADVAHTLVFESYNYYLEIAAYSSVEVGFERYNYNLHFGSSLLD